MCMVLVLFPFASVDLQSGFADLWRVWVPEGLSCADVLAELPGTRDCGRYVRFYIWILAAYKTWLIVSILSVRCLSDIILSCRNQ